MLWSSHSAVDGPDNLKPIVCTSGSFADTQLKWSATEKEVFAVYQSVLNYELHLRRSECMLCCHHKPLESFLLKGMTVPKLNQWAMELKDYNITFVPINSSSNILANTISRLKP